jgi:hypothetical protein
VKPEVEGSPAERDGTRRDWEPRPAGDDDWPSIVELIRHSMGWAHDAPLGDYLDWKHRQNPFGPSSVWVAAADDRIVGARLLLNWEFDAPGGRVFRAVRAVDTATSESHRGQGIFTAITLMGIEARRKDGYDFVFNTPNDQSRPGYLKMGWRQVGRLPVSVRPLRLSALPALRRSGVAAERFSVSTDAAEPAGDVLADTAAVEALLADIPAASVLRTRRSPAYLRWRYDSFPPLHYRAVIAGDTRKGVAIFRLRQRGESLEAAVVEVLGRDRGSRRRLLAQVARACGADHAIVLSRGQEALAAGFLPLPGRGPILTCRPLSSDGPREIAGWDFGLGDIELF